MADGRSLGLWRAGWVRHQVLIASTLINTVNWPDQSVTLGLTRHAIQPAPVYDPLVQPDPAQELRLYQHYGRLETLPRTGRAALRGAMRQVQATRRTVPPGLAASE